jgi:hypothetical protein
MPRVEVAKKMRVIKPSFFETPRVLCWAKENPPFEGFYSVKLISAPIPYWMQ